MTSPNMDIQIVQLLFSRFCHEIAAPIGAVNNGIELISGAPEDEDAEALELVSQSARQAALELEFARLAFGFGGGSANGYLVDAERLCKALFTTERIVVIWRCEIDDEDVPKEIAKLLANLVITGDQALRGRGSLVVALDQVGDGYRVVVTAEGAGAALTPGMIKALDGVPDMNDMTPATSQGFFTYGLAELADCKLSAEDDASDRVVITATSNAR